MTNRQLTLLKYSLEDFTSSQITTRRPMAVVEPVRLKDQELREAIERSSKPTLVPRSDNPDAIIRASNAEQHKREALAAHLVPIPASPPPASSVLTKQPTMATFGSQVPGGFQFRSTHSFVFLYLSDWIIKVHSMF
ncbi:hypothetical protein PGT21_018197 [Puccinia graminis f. sp. tritici]|uniref:Uncharacterized protein n=1 Tax=Puccinia graminis f. sp. tritici TaxID=56615 RepID=A0A5B0Q652_PUCGR|nr:hypothetical protein PGT21_018197 [Puccinia graminis f. sp. tritici]